MGDEKHNQKSKINIIFYILSFIIPIIGLIIYFANKDRHTGKTAGICALVGFALELVIVFIIISFYIFNNVSLYDLILQILKMTLSMT